jgi:hypothetical protein
VTCVHLSHSPTPVPSDSLPLPTTTPLSQPDPRDLTSSSLSLLPLLPAIACEVESASTLLSLSALPVRYDEVIATQSLDILRSHSIPAAATPTTILPSSPSPTQSTTIPSSSPSLSLQSVDDNRSVDVLLATPTLSKASASSLPATNPATQSVSLQPQLNLQQTSATTTTTTPTVTASVPFHFLQRLNSRPRSHAQHFHHHFLPSAPLCECHRFPVYSSKLGDPPSACKLAAVSHLCLSCIEELLSHRYDTTPEIGAVFFTAQMREEWEDFYQAFYNKDEVCEVESWESEEELFQCFDRSMQRIMFWLSKRGVRRTCPHVAGACREVHCCLGTEAVVALAGTA